MGPIGYLVVEFPGNKVTGEALPKLVDLVDRGLIRILDLVFVSKDSDGRLSILELADIDGDGDLDLMIFEGASSGMLHEDDINEAGNAVEPGAAAAIMIYENHWAAEFVGALRTSGAQLVASGFIPMDDVLAALDATD
jgi:uncharacterized membrane protein